MKVFTLSLFGLLLSFSSVVVAQGTPVPATNDTDAVETTDMTIEDLTQADAPAKMSKEDKGMADVSKEGSMLEFGITPNYTFVGGDVEATGGYGIGAHFRKSLDHLFSLRLDGQYGALSGDNESNMIGNRRFESRYIAGTGFAVVTLNNFRFQGGIRKMNLYVMAGAGANFFETAYQQVNQTNFDEDDPFEDDTRNGLVAREFAPHAAAGAGISFRVSPRFNFGFEYQSHIPLGSRADLIDGYSTGSNFRDVVSMAGLNLNFNLGNSSKKMEPRYWENPFNAVRSELDRVSNKVDDATRDSDGDGVVDAVDQEANTPAGVPVDTRGRVLDSDKDGVPDYKDLEPFFPPRAGETVDENGVVINRNDKAITEDRVQEMIDASIARMQAGQQGGTTTVRTERGEVYLPMIYFPLGQSTIKYADYGTLSSVARVIQGNPGLRVVVRGYTDRTGNSSNNVVLSYRRAKAVVDHLVNQHGISRNSLILQYRGEENAIVPLNKSYVNRRVEFLTAEPGAGEDPIPAGAKDRGGF